MNGQVINDIYDKVNDEMERLSMTADYKLAGSNMEQYMKLDNFNNLQSQDTVKFVVSSEEDLKRALEIIRQYNLTEKCYVYFSPVFGKIEPVTIVNFKEKAGGPEWIIAILMGEVVAQDLNLERLNL